jgi:hypothetical protein
VLLLVDRVESESESASDEEFEGVRASENGKCIEWGRSLPVEEVDKRVDLRRRDGSLVMDSSLLCLGDGLEGVEGTGLAPIGRSKV